VVGFQGNATTLDSATVNGAVGDTFQIIDNTVAGPNGFFITNATGQLKKLGQQPQQDVLCQTNLDCIVGGGMSYTFEIVAPGTFTVKANGKDPTTLTIPGAQQAPIYIPFEWAMLDPNGGTCTINGEVKPSGWFAVMGLSVRFPGSKECQRPGYRLEAWVNGAVTKLPGDLVTGLGAPYVAQWTKLIPPAPPGPATALVNFQCAPCNKADLWWGPSPTADVTYEVVLSSGQTTLSTTPVASVPNPGLAPFSLTNLSSGLPYRIEVFAVKDGVRSETGAPFAPVAQATPISLSEFFSSILQTPTNYADFVLAGAPAQCPIKIADSGRRTVSGKPGVYAAGTAIGLPTGEALKVWLRFPGQTSYTEGTAKPQVGSLGEFEWARKTGKKTYVYFTRASDPNCKSNRVIIPAN